MQRIALLILLFALGVLPSASEASSPFIADYSGRLGEDGIPMPWRLKVNAGNADVRIVSSEAGTAVRMRSDQASFAIERDISVAAEHLRDVRWLWRADALPRRGDLRELGKNDQVLQVLFAFEGQRIISYVWDSNAPVGTIRDESLPWPLSLKVKVIVAASGEQISGKWLLFRRNVASDYQRVYGGQVPPLRGLRLQTNSQHTGDLGIGYFGPVSFSVGHPTAADLR